MNSLVENLVISFLTGLVAAATQIATVPAPSEPRDWSVIAAAGIIAFGGSFINGQRQLRKTPPGAE